MTIADLRSLLAKATPGPLKLHGCDEHGYTPDPGLLCYGVRGADRGYARTQADRELHCAAVNALPAFLELAAAAEKVKGMRIHRLKDWTDETLGHDEACAGCALDVALTKLGSK